MSDRPPLDSRNHECAKIALAPGAARDRLTAGMFFPKDEADVTGALEAAFVATIACEPVDEKIRKAVKKGKITPRPGIELGVIAKENNIISAEEYALWSRKEALRKRVIKVDDFPADFGRAEIVQSIDDATVKMKAA